jgi:hypothetical protein
MANSSEPIQDDVLDELVSQLLDCGGVLSQMIGGMVERRLDAPLRTQPRFQKSLTH